MQANSSCSCSSRHWAVEG